jgi:hypothetical protein
MKRLRTGEGELVDVSAFEAVVHGFDPGFGTQGSAAAGRKESFPRDRPDAAAFYPVFPCADGHVRTALLAPRQWQGMLDWLGSPEEFTDPKYNHIATRFAASDRLHPLIGALFADSPRADLVAEGTKRGIPIAAVLCPAEVLVADHFAASGALVDAEIADGLTARVPHGYLSIDGERAGLRHRAPRVGEHNAEPFPARDDVTQPLEMSSEMVGPPTTSDDIRSGWARQCGVVCRDWGWRACSARSCTPWAMPPARLPAANDDVIVMAASAQARSSTQRRAREPVMISRLRALGSTKIRTESPASAPSSACRRLA